MNKQELGSAVRGAMIDARGHGYNGEFESATVDRLTAGVMVEFPELGGWDRYKIRNVIAAQFRFGRWDREDELTTAQRRREAERETEIAQRVAQFEEALRSFDVLGPFVIESVITGDSVRIGG